MLISKKERLLQYLHYYKEQSLVRKVLLAIFAGSAFIVLSVLLLFFFVWSGLLGSLPSQQELRLVENPVSSEVYSADSVLIGRYYIQERSDILFEQIPPHVIDALVSTEDARFYNHHGIDYRSLWRVLLKSLILRSDASGGGSTLTQQLAKNLFPRKQYWILSTPINKIREMIIAWRMEGVYIKDELLALYLNTVPFGDNTFGIEAAAQRFFSKSAHNLAAEEAAVLIGMLKATYSYNPRIFPNRAKQRRDVVLAQMEKYGKLTADEKDSLQLKPVILHYTRLMHHEGLAPYFREYIRKELLVWCATHKNEKDERYNLYTDGLKIYTTIDSRLQRYAEQATTKQMTQLQNAFAKHWGKTEPWYNQVTILEEAIKKSNRYKALRKLGKSHDEILLEMKKPVLTTVFTWQGEKELKLSPIDSVMHYLKFLNAGMLAMDPRDGSVLVWVGGINHQYFQFDHVRESTKRQVGSTFKPLVYAAALENGMKPCDYISAEKTTYQVPQEWTPLNTEENYDLKYSMEGALAHSVNTVAVHALEQAGIDNTIALASNMGINSDLPSVPSLALGTPNVSVIEMVTTYSCMANNGKSVKPFYITSITSHSGNILESYQKYVGEQVLSENNAKLIVQMLKRVVDEGTGSSLRWKFGLTNDISGKTGTTQSNADGWFMAMTPNLVVGAWVGADDPRIRFRSTSLGQGATTALPIVANFLKQVNADGNFKELSQARFEELPGNLQRKLSCDMFKSDKSVLQKIFGKKETASTRKFGEKKEKKGFFKKLFGL